MRRIYENRMFVFNYPINCTWKYYIKCLLSPILDLIYKLILRIKYRQPIQKKYAVSICAIFKDEAHNLKEWIEYHRIVGVEHFYLYNNFSTDNFQQVLDPYIKIGLVSLINWPISPGQFSAYQNFYEKYRIDSQWVSFLDIDEFFVPSRELSVVNWVKKFEKYPCVVVYWKMFGTSGNLIHNPLLLTTEQYTISWSKIDSIGKVFWNTDYDIANFDTMVHHATRTKIKFVGYEIEIPPVNEFNKFLFWGIHRTANYNSDDVTMQINHYWSKSYKSYYKNKVERGDVNNHLRDDSVFFLHEHHNTSVDYKIYRFLIELKIAMGMFNSTKK